MKVRLSKCSIGSSEIAAVKGALKSEYLGMGSIVLEFELAIKKYLNTSLDVICVNTGTSALQLSLSALDIKQGDEVLVPSLTYVGSFQAISATGATPVACEVERETFFLDVEDARKKITRKTKAIMPVHYGGSAKYIDAVYELANEFSLRVVEDAAQAFGCVRSDHFVGAKGDIICFSFDGIKNITCGEGGAILTGDKSLVGRLRDDRLLGVQRDSEKRYHGKRSWDFDVENQGFRFHMSNINAAIGLAQIKRINNFRKIRQGIAERYLEELATIPEVIPLNLNYGEVMPHIFVVKAEERDELRDYLAKTGVETGIHYKPNHLLTKFRSKKEFPVTEECYLEALTLPCHVDVTEEELIYVINSIKNFYNA